MAAMAFDGLGALLEDAHVDLDDSDTKDGRPLELGFDLSDADHSVNRREGDRSDREAPEGFGSGSACSPPTPGLVNREVDQGHDDRHEHRTAELCDLHERRLREEAVGEIGWEKGRVEPLDQEQRRDGDEARAPTTLSKGAVDQTVNREIESQIGGEQQPEQSARRVSVPREHVEELDEPVVASGAGHRAVEPTDSKAVPPGSPEAELERAPERHQANQGQRPNPESGPAEEIECASKYRESVRLAAGPRAGVVGAALGHRALRSTRSVDSRTMQSKRSRSASSMLSGGTK